MATDKESPMLTHGDVTAMADPLEKRLLAHTTHQLITENHQILYENLKNLHDAEIIGIDAATAPARLKVVVKTLEHATPELLLEQCSHYRITDFTLHNTISRAMIFDSSSASEQAIGELIRWLTSLSDAASFLTDSKWDELTASLLDGNIKLIYLEPSQGAELAI